MIKREKCPAEEEISMLVDGELGEKAKGEVLDHIKTCDKCEKVYKRLKNVDKALKFYGKLVFDPRLMQRTNECPDEETMAAFLDGTLSKRERAKILGHISKCNYCFDLVNSKYQYDEEFAKARVMSPAEESEKILRNGIGYYKKGSYETALRCAVRALQIKSQWGRALDLKANCEKKILKQKEKIANEDYI